MVKRRVWLLVFLVAIGMVSISAGEIEVSGVGINKDYNYSIRTENVLEGEGHKVTLKSEITKNVVNDEVVYDNIRFNARWQTALNFPGELYGEVELRDESVSGFRYSQLGSGYTNEFKWIGYEIGFLTRFPSEGDKESFINTGLIFKTEYLGFELVNKYNYLFGEEESWKNELSLSRPLKENLYLKVSYLREKQKELDHKEACFSVVYKY